VLDNFNRGDGAIGAAWSGETGAGMFLVASNKLDVLSGGLITWNAGKLAADQEVYFTYSTIDTDAGEIDLVLKQQTAGSQDEMIEVLYSHANTRVEVWTNDTPTTGWTQRGANITGITLAAGDVFGASCDASGLVRVYVNGTEIGNRDCSAWPHYAATGYIGIWVLTAGDAILDDFGGGDIVSGVARLSDGYFADAYFSVWWPVDYWQEETTTTSVLIAQDRSLFRSVFGRVFGRVN
jgi:hypothetical protein